MNIYNFKYNIISYKSYIRTNVCFFPIFVDYFKI